jgi:hypothetical protein
MGRYETREGSADHSMCTQDHPDAPPLDGAHYHPNTQNETIRDCTAPSQNTVRWWHTDPRDRPSDRNGSFDGASDACSFPRRQAELAAAGDDDRRSAVRPCRYQAGHRRQVESDWSLGTTGWREGTATLRPRWRCGSGHGEEVGISPSHGENRGSSPLGSASKINKLPGNISTRPG